MSLSVEEILMSRRSSSGFTEEIYRRRQEEERKKKAEAVADLISKMMDDAKTTVGTLIEDLQAARRAEVAAKQALNAVGIPFLYAESGLEPKEAGATMDVKKIAPLVIAMGLSLEDFDLPEDVNTEVPEDFQK